jgi:rhodanese-related sulfurtransferase
MKKNTRKASSRMTIPVWGWVMLAVVVLAAAGVMLLQRPPAAAVALPAEISVDQAAQKRDQGAYMLDVRERSEWDQFHIPGAALIPLGELPKRLADVPKDREIVVVCRSGNRSITGRDILLQAGFKQVTSMAGGVTEWQFKKLPIATGP